MYINRLLAMNYFELFQIPVQLHVDKADVKRKFFELSRKSHPDYFVNASEEDQAESLESSAMLNHALKVFSNPDATIAYVLELKGLLEEHEKYTLDPEFLLEMMDLNEAFAESGPESDPAEKVRLAGLLEEAEEAIRKPVENILSQYLDGVTTTEDLLQVKDYYFKKKYLYTK